MQSDYEKVTALIVKLKEEEKDIERYLQLLNEFVKITIDLCNYFYENTQF